MNIDPLNQMLKTKLGVVIRPIAAAVVTAGLAIQQQAITAAHDLAAQASAGLDTSTSSEGAVGSALDSLGLGALAPFAPVIVGLAVLIKRKRDGQV